MRDGKRELFMNSPLKTNLCMSNPVVQDMMAQAMAEYAANHQNVTHLVFAFADSDNTQCECPACTGSPSEYMVQILNKADALMTARGINTKIVFGMYLDTLIPPERSRYNNPDRFALLYCPITRSYTKSIDAESLLPEVPLTYVRNQFVNPDTAEANFAYLRKWQDVWEGTSFCYEYHYWIHQYNDPGLMYLSRRVYEDNRALKIMGLQGCIEDGSQRSFFPHAFHMHIYAESLFDRECDYDQVKEDYFKHIYGDDWKAVVDLMQSITDTFDFAYMEGEKSLNAQWGRFYNPEQAKRLAAVKELAQRERELAAAHMTMPTRPQTVSYRMLDAHATYIEALAEVMEQKALGNDAKAKELVAKFKKTAGALELQWERYYDHFLAGKNIVAIINQAGKQLF